MADPDNTQALTPEAKRALLRELLRKTGAAAQQPVSAGQRALWFMHQLDPSSPAYNVISRWRTRSRVDVAGLRQAFQGVVDRHAILRSTFEVSAQGEPVRLIHEGQPVSFDLVEAEGWDEARLEAALNDAASLPFDLEKGPACRVGLFSRAADDHVLQLACHHIAYDHWSLSRVMADWVGLYDAIRSRTDPVLTPSDVSYADYVQWQSALLASPHGDRLRDYWDRQLSGELPVLDLPTDRPRPPAQRFVGRSHLHRFEPSLAVRVNGFAKSAGVTPYVVMLSAFFALLHRYSGQTDLVVGSPMSGRSRPEFADVVGYFVNPVAIRSGVDGGMRFVALVTRVRDVVLEAIEHADLPFPSIIERLQPDRDPSRSPIFQAAFTWDKVAVPAPAGGLDLEFVMGTQMGSNFDLDLIVLDQGTTLEAVWRFSTDLFEEQTIARMAAHYARLLEHAIDAPSSRVADLRLNSETERRDLLWAWNPPPAQAAPLEGSLVARFELQTARTPGATAVTTESDRLAYAALNERANQLARSLRARGVAPGHRVALFVERSSWLVAGALGILKTGAAYVPIDPAYPADRVRFMLADSGAAAVVSESSLWDNAGHADAAALLIDRDRAEIGAESSENLDESVDPEALAYVIYTSGSTGRPKGVGVTHRHVMRLFDATVQWFAFGPQDVWTLFHSAAFDFSVWELWGALLYGGRLVVVPFWVSRAPDAFRELLGAEHVTVLNQTPSAFRQLMEADAQAAGAPLSLRYVIFGGEALDVRSLRPWVERHGVESPRLVNMYGITETTVHVTYRPLGETDVRHGAGSVLGQPIPDLSVYVLDSRGEPSPIGVRGEIYVGGAGVTRGYLGRPRLTAQRFLPDPFSGQPGARLYRSGDLARRLPDGDLEYLGRIDQQVKIRGFRIELGEIEAAIARHPAVQDAVVLALERGLVAYVVPRADVAGAARRLTAWERAGRLGDRRWCELPNGQAVVHLNRNETDFLYEEIFESGRYLRHGVDIDPHACVFDVGANIGMFSLFIGWRAPGATIFAFEPIPPVCDRLALNAELHGLDVRIMRCGLAAEEGEAVFTYYPNVSIFSGRFADAGAERSVVRAFLENQTRGAAAPELLDELLGDRLKTETVTSPLTTVSAVMRRHGVERIDLLKIDVEKSELSVLEGVGAADWPKIQQVIVEVHDEHGRLAAVTSLLTRHGFSVVVDQDASLAGTGLHNVYAARAPRPAREIDRAPAGWSSPTRLVADLRQHIGRSLPDYMVPAEFVLLDALPLTANGKLDRRGLPDATPSRRERVAPRTPVERQIAGIWCEVLGLDAVGVRDNFFELGGHSLLATKVISRVRAATSVALPLRRLFDDPTVEGLALAVIEQQAAEVGPETFLRALAEIEGLK